MIVTKQSASPSHKASTREMLSCYLYPSPLTDPSLFTGHTGALTIIIIRVREQHIHRPRIQFVFLLRSSQIVRRVIARARLSAVEISFPPPVFRSPLIGGDTGGETLGNRCQKSAC